MTTCECCNIEEETQVFATPFCAYSVRLCNTCITEELYPHWLLVSAVGMIGSFIAAALLIVVPAVAFLIFVSQKDSITRARR